MSSKLVEFSYQHLFTLQWLLCEVMGVPATPATDPKTGKVSPAVMEAAIGLTVESSEILDALNKEHRKWKKPGNIIHEIEEEAVDVLFYLLEMFNVLGLDHKMVFLLYLRKYVINIGRHISTYSDPILETALNYSDSITVDKAIESSDGLVSAFALLSYVVGMLDRLDQDELSMHQRLIADDTRDRSNIWLRGNFKAGRLSLTM